jgi:hypothetical protein
MVLLATATGVAATAVTPSGAGAALGDALDPMIGVSVAHVPNDSSATVKVNALARLGSTVFVGGNFTQLAPYAYPTDPAVAVPQGQGIDRPYLLAVNGTTGNVVWTFNPQLDGAVHALEVDPTTNTLYVGGSFSTVNGQAVARFAILDATTGALKAGVTQLPADGEVLALHRHGPSGKLYIGGTFITIGGRNRGEAARLSLPANTIDNWKIQVTGRVLSVALDPDSAAPASVYLGGEFVDVLDPAGVPLPEMDYVASFSTAEPPTAGAFAPVIPTWDPVLTTASPNPNSQPRVRSIAVKNGRVFAAVGGGQGRFLVWEVADAAQVAFYIVNGDGQAVKVVDGMVLLGGHFERILNGSTGARDQCHIFALDLANPAAGPLANPNVINGAHYGAFAIEAWDSDGDGTQETTFWGGHLVRMSQVGGTQACSDGAQNPWGGIWKLRQTPAAPDVVNPTAPGAPVVSGLFNSAGLSWTPASDANGVVAYYVYVNNALYDVVPGNQTSTTVTGLTPETAYTFRVRAVDPSTRYSDSPSAAWVSGQPVPSLPSPLNGFGQYNPVNPWRVLDTRNGSGAVAAGADREVQVAGFPANGVPVSGVQMVALNVTAVDPSANGHLTVYPNGESAPFVSNLNFKAGETVPNLVVARVGSGNRIKVKVNAGSAHVLVDVVGWYGSDQTLTAGSKITTQSPARVLDTRPATKVGPYDKVGPQQTIDVQVVAPGSGITGVVVNLTATEPTTSTYVTAFPGDQGARPEVSNLNLVAGQTRPNLAMVRVPTSGPAAGKIRLYNHLGATHLIVDVVATYTASTLADPAGRMLALSKPLRLLDTRLLGPAPGPGTIVRPMADIDASTPASVTGLVVNATATEATNNTYLTLYPTDSPAVPPPVASNLNVKPGFDVPNLAVTSLTAADNLGVYNLTGSVHYILDLTALVVG